MGRVTPFVVPATETQPALSKDEIMVGAQVSKVLKPLKKPFLSSMELLVIITDIVRFSDFMMMEKRKIHYLPNPNLCNFKTIYFD